MNTNSKRLGIYLGVMLSATAVATTMRSIAYVMHLDHASGFFSDKSLVRVSDAIIVLTVLGMFSYLFAARIDLRASFSTGATYVPTGILGAASAFLGMQIFSYALASSNYRISVKELLSLAGVPTLITLLAGVLAFVSIAYYFFNAFVTESKDVTRAYFSIVAIAFLALYAVMIYTDSSISLNATGRALRQTAFLFIAIFFLYESRISLGREKWRIYTAFGLAAATLTAYASVPAIVVYFANKVIVSSSGYKSLASIEEYLFLFAAFIFILSRLCLTIILKEEKENELVKALANIALAREAEVNEALEMHEEIFASKQLSIFDLYGDNDEEVIEELETAEEVEESDEKTVEPILSDDVIYESIFGKMPEKKEEVKSEEETEIDERDPEEIAENILKILDNDTENESDI